MKVKTVLRNGRKMTLFERGDGRQDISFSTDLISQLLGKDLSTSFTLIPPPNFVPHNDLQSHLFKIDCLRSNRLPHHPVKRDSWSSKALLLPNAHKQFWLAYESKREKGLHVKYTFVDEEEDILNTCIINIQTLRQDTHKYVVLGLMISIKSYHAMDSLLLPLSIHALEGIG